MKKIAILGATGHIAKNLIFNFKKSGEYNLFLFARSTEKLNSFLRSINYFNDIKIINLDDFENEKFDVVINCTGIGDPGKLKDIGSEIFKLTEDYDNFILKYLENNKNCTYINFSSGAVYGRDFNVPADKLSCCEISVNNICNEDIYGIMKLYSEAKHRSYKNYNIVDLRIFAFFSRFIDINAHFFITELISCIKTGKEFRTGKNDIIRDFIHPSDLFSLINLCIDIQKINDVFDAYSLKPVTKFEVLNYFKESYGLKCRIESDVLGLNPTGVKDNYYSINKKAENIGYEPEFSAMDCIINETKEILKIT